MIPGLTIENLSKTFERGKAFEKRVLKGFDLTLQPGDFISLIGSNGTGKTTLLNCIAGVMDVDAGIIRLDGRDLTGLSTQVRARDMARVFQDPKLGTAGDLTVEENLAIAWRRGQKSGLSHGVRSTHRERFRERLATLGLGLEDRLDTPVELLSGGQRQALALVMATLRQPKLLLLDEHTAALDPQASHMVMELTRQLVTESGQTTLMITHNMDNAIRYGQRLIMLHEGRIIVDVEGAEKEKLTVTGLVDLFRELTDGGVLTDSACLA